MEKGFSKRFACIGIMSMLLMGALFVVATNVVTADYLEGDYTYTVSGVASDPIWVDGDIELTTLVASQGWNGTGTVSDPYVIEGLRFIALEVDELVHIANTHQHLLLRNITIFLPSLYGFRLESVSNVTLDRCEVTNGSYAISLEECQDAVVSNCTVSGNWYGVELISCQDIIVRDNDVMDSYMESISLDSCHRISVKDNLFRNYNDGISLQYSTNNLIESNTIIDISYGIKLYYADDNQIDSNLLFGSSIYCYQSNRNSMFSNVYEDSPSGYAFNNIELMGSSDNIIHGNILRGGWIWLDSSNRNIVQDNQISNHSYGIRIQGSATDNVLWGNELHQTCIIIWPESSEHASQTISTNNTVDGKPVYYYKDSNMHNATVPLDAGEVIAENVSYLTIENLVLSGTYAGIQVHFSEYITVRGNTVQITSWTDEGILLHRVNRSSVENNNLISANIELHGSNNNSIIGNHVTDSLGIQLDNSIYNLVHGNELVNASISLSSGSLLFADPLADLMFSENNITPDNTVNGGPVYFIKYTDMGGGTVPLDAGQVILAYVSNVRISDLDFGHQFMSLFMHHCSDYLLENNSFEEISSAISIEDSDYGRIQYNTLRNCGICMSIEGSNNIINHNSAINDDSNAWRVSSSTLGITGSYNVISDNELYGLHDNAGVVGGHNRIERNHIEGGRSGLGIGGYLHLDSSQNTILDNFISNCSYYGILVHESNENKIIGNVIKNCGIGVYIQGTEDPSTASSDSTLYSNSLTGCSISLSYSQATATSQTIATNNTVNGRPVYYYKSTDLGGASVPLGAGEVILVDVKNVVVQGLDLSNQSHGLLALFCSSISVLDCAFENNSLTGVQTFTTKSCTIKGNIIVGGIVGLDLKITERDNISDNVILDSDTAIILSGKNSSITGNRIERGGGMMLNVGTNCIISHNIINDSTGWGLYIYFSTGNEIKENVISRSASYGITLESCLSNVIERNKLTGNNGCTSTYDISHVQAFDDQLNLWNSTLGNYWSDWTTPDTNRDGIVDLPYPLAGSGYSIDRLPLVLTALDKPIVEILYPRDQDLLNNSEVEVVWTGEDLNGSLAYYWIMLDSGTWENASGNESWTFHDLGEGSHNVVVMGFNQTGGNGTDEVSFVIDTIAPTIITHSPSGDGVPPTSVVIIEFSEAMNETTVIISVSGVTGTVVWDNINLTFTPSQTLAAGSHHTVNVSGSDLAGNSLEYQWSFDVTKNAQDGSFNWLWLIILLVAIIAIVVYYVYRKRRKKKKT
jgi:parallel beta-helix repeat protein